MTKEECYFLGYISKPFGYKGQLVLFLDVDNILEYKDLDAVFVDTASGLVPYFISSIKLRERDAIVEFENLSAEEATKLVGKELYLPLELLPKLSGNKFYFHEVIGFEVQDKNFGGIGKIKTIYDNGPQSILSIENEGKEIMIPIVDQFILEVDREKKLLVVEAPEGLIDFYLEQPIKIPNPKKS